MNNTLGCPLVWCDNPASSLLVYGMLCQLYAIYSLCFGLFTYPELSRSVCVCECVLSSGEVTRCQAVYSRCSHDYTFKKCSTTVSPTRAPTYSHIYAAPKWGVSCTPLYLLHRLVVPPQLYLLHSLVSRLHARGRA